jgi:sialate O-acetylesterase
VWCFGSDGRWEIARDPLHRPWESFTPVHQNFMRGNLGEEDRQKSNEEIAARERETCKTGAGLGLAFGKAMADATGKPIALIPASHGGTSLEDWNFNRKAEGGASLYGGMLERVQKARESADFDIKGVLWYQGESDAFEGASTTYAERMKAWIEAMRVDLQIPDLPFYAVQISRVLMPEADPNQVWQTKYWEDVREALRLLPERVPNCDVVSAIDLGLCDTIHIDTAGLIRLGKRMARLATGEVRAPRLARIEKGGAHALGFGIARVVCENVSGGWNPKHHIGGFGIQDESGKTHPKTMIIAANADVRDPKVINVTFNTPLDDSIRLGYGLGLNPYCNAVDDADMPLPAFTAQSIS